MTLPGKPLPLLWRSVWRYTVQHRWQSLLSLLGIMLGVMMVVAVDLASTSARRAFDLSVESVSGVITHQIVGGSAGVPEEIFTSIRTGLGLRRSAPVLSAEVRIKEQSLTLLGLDLISEASLQRRLPGLDLTALDLARMGAAAMRSGSSAILSRDVAASLGLNVGDEFRLNPPDNNQTLVLAAVLEADVADTQILFTDIALAQIVLHKEGSLDSIDLVLDDNEAERLRLWLPAGVTLVQAAGRNAALEQTTEAFQVNLLAMSLLALLVAALLIYNTVSLSVLERRATFGVLRSLGVSRTQVTCMVLLENALLGALGSALGVVAGIWLGSFLVQLVTRTIDDLYFNLTVSSFLVEPLLLYKGFSWGLLVTLLAAALPAWRAGLSPPITLQHKGTDGANLQRRLPWFSALAVVMLLVGTLVLESGGGLVSGFVALNLLIFGFCLLVPHCLHLILGALLRVPWFRRYLSLRLALRAIQSGLDRTALAVAALTVAVSVTVGVGIMVSSLRDTVILWLDQTLEGDVQITRMDTSSAGGISMELQQTVAAMPEVTSYQFSYLVSTESSFGALRVQAGSGNPQDWLFMKQGGFVGDDSVLIAEPMASVLQLSVGDTLALLTTQGTQQLAVTGIFYDYTTGNPLLALTHGQFERFWPAVAARRMTLYLKSGTNPETFVADVRRNTGAINEPLVVTANSSIRERTLAIFDRTFAITHVLRLLAVVVAFVGVFSAMLALQLQRLRDYAILRASGMTVTEVGRLILLQTLMMGVLAGLLALPLGMLMSDVLIDVINMRSFGWSMLHSLPVSVLLQAVVLAVVAALLAGVYPARRVSQVHPADALRGE